MSMEYDKKSYNGFYNKIFVNIMLYFSKTVE